MKKILGFKQLVLIHLILILILVGMIIKIKVQESSYDCEECIITFKNWMEYGNLGSKMIIEAPLNKLYQGYIKDDCPIIWVKGKGYSPTKGGFNITVEDMDIETYDE